MFLDRNDAGSQLAGRLLHLRALRDLERSELIVLSIPRGGALVGHALAHALGCEHTVVVVKKIGLPGDEELAVGAMSEDGQIFLDMQALQLYDVNRASLKPIIARTKARIDQYVQVFRQGQPLQLHGKTVILTDDGIATGETMKAAVRAVQTSGETRQIIIAVPVCARRAASELRPQVDEFVSIYLPDEFLAVGQFYWQFPQVSDEEVLDVLQAQRQR